MNRVILVAAAAAEMAAKVKEVVDAAAAAGVKTAVYKPCANGAEAAAELKEHRSAVLMEKSTGAVLFAKDEHAPREPASVTKILTLLLTKEAPAKPFCRVPGVSVSTERQAA